MAILRRLLRSSLFRLTLAIVCLFLALLSYTTVRRISEIAEKQKQEATVFIMSTIGEAWMTWLSDQVGPASAGGNKIYYFDARGLKPITHEQLFQDLVVPKGDYGYLADLPKLDAWGHKLQFCKHDNSLAGHVMIICSPGKNGRLGDNPTGVAACCGVQWRQGELDPAAYDQDLVWADGYWVRRPPDASHR